jgi:hypothetical protein
MSLLDDMRMRVRVTSTATDEEIDGEIYAAIADMRRVGIKEHLLNAETPNPLVKHAIAMYCRAYYGYDNANERPQFIAAYERTVCDLLNSKANEYLFPEESDGEESPDSSGEDGTTGDGTDDGGGS